MGAISASEATLPCTSASRPASTSARLRLLDCESISGEGSIPHTPRPAEPPERLLEADTRPGPKLGDLPGVRTVLAGLLHDPPAELGVAPGHATSDQPTERPMRTAELPGYDRHQLPPSGSRQPPVATVPIDAATSISGVKTAKATSGHAASSAVVRWCALVARRRGSGRGCAWLGLPVALGSLVRWCAAAGAAGWRGLVCAWARYRSSRR